MRKAAGIGWLLLVTLPGAVAAPAAEDCRNYSVQASSVIAVLPPRITLSWPQDTNGIPLSYTVHRKAPGAPSWGPGTTLPGSATSFADADVAVGRAYEYRIVKAAGSYTGYGYVQTGIDVPLVDARGTVVLVVDRTHAGSLAIELDRLERDLVGDGWTVRRRDVDRADSVVSVKNLIKADYDADPAGVQAVFLFGHVPVPYSGKLNPDRHPDHVGAWPADVYYGDMQGRWTDCSVDYRQRLNRDPGDAARLSNVPGDGKFDQSTIPGAVELQIGRVDFANLPGRASAGGPATLPSEEELLRQYLNKDHRFRHRLLAVPRRAIVGDYFGVRGGEAFSASGWRSFAPLVGAENIANLNLGDQTAGDRWLTAVAGHDYLLAYGCGPGSYLAIEGLGATGPENSGNTADMAGNDRQAVFTLIFGSWLGDWDHEDDLMRALLAAPTGGLAAAWSGRPHWFVHPMGLGETIGYAARLTQNNTGLYQNQVNGSANGIHIALMGDPTLRLHPVAPGGELAGARIADGTALAWAPSPEAVAGYHVYRATPAHPAFVRLTREPEADTMFVDADGVAGATYMVRAVKLESTPSGSYYNASQGMFWSAGDSLAGAGDRGAAPPPAPPSAAW
jgi:hypothetical protein